MKLFVVDDEEIIREGIRNCIEKEGDNFVFCGEAPDGEMALPMLQELQPDVLITDVRMPFMDGLELAALVRKSMPWTHIVILSGHDEFEYAQKAVSLGVDAYILKPIDSKLLLETLSTVADRLKKEKEYYQNIHEGQKRDEAEKIILRDSFCARLVGGTVTLSEALETAPQYQLNLLAQKYIVGQTKLSGSSSEETTKIRMLAGRLFEKRADIISFLTGTGRLVYIVKGDHTEAVVETAYETAQLLRHELERYFSIDVPFGIGKVVDRLGELPQSYTSSKEVMHFMHGSKILGYSDIRHDNPNSALDFSSNVPLRDQLRHAIKEDIPKLVENYFAAAGDKDVQSALYRYYLLMDLVVTACRTVTDLGVNPAELVPDAGNPQKILTLADTPEKSRRYAEDVLVRLVGLRGDYGENRYGEVIRKAREYIAENYNDPSLSLHTVAKEVGFSPNHFSTIFSQETGETFVEHLTRKRMDAAKAMLRESDRRLSDIAFDIGYNEPHYFSYIFKKNVGMTPREYRSSFQNS